MVIYPSHAVIQRFADAHGIIIVRFFIDAGKSGVGIQGRDALQDLLRRVEGGQAELQYDSRVRRQSVETVLRTRDEGAYYEFRCIRANTTVQYCAEQFPTENAPMPLLGDVGLLSLIYARLPKAYRRTGTVLRIVDHDFRDTYPSRSRDRRIQDSLEVVQ